MTRAGVLDPHTLAELQRAADRSAGGVRDPEDVRKACAEMDRIREELRREHGVVDIGVPAIGEFRDRE